jgi:hypothetical protein
MTTPEPTTPTAATPTAPQASAEPAPEPVPAVPEPITPEGTVDPVVPTTTEDTHDTDTADDADPRLSKIRAEAKGLRGRLRDAEVDNGLHRATLAAMQETDAARLAAGRGALADGTDLFRAGVHVADLLAEDGTVDPAKVADAVAGVIAERPHWGWQGTPAPAGRARSTGPTFHDLIAERNGAAAAQATLRSGLGSHDEHSASWADVLRG